jgi:hypothetical protein
MIDNILENFTKSRSRKNKIDNAAYDTISYLCNRPRRPIGL